jgi:WD40 repeat protein
VGSRGESQCPQLDLSFPSSHVRCVLCVSVCVCVQYIATYGEDKAVKVWIVDKEYKYAKAFALVVEPYGQLQHRGPTAHMDWSPDGRFLSTTNGFMPPRMTAPVLARKDWSVAASFVGHSLVVGAARFNPSLFRPTNTTAGSNA